MRSEVLVEEVVLDHLAEIRVIRDPLVKVEVQVDDLLNDLLDLVVKGDAHVLQRVDLRGRVERGVLLQPLHHPAEREAVFWAQLNAEALVKFGDDV